MTGKIYEYDPEVKTGRVYNPDRSNTYPFEASALTYDARLHDTVTFETNGLLGQDSRAINITLFRREES